MTTRSRARRLTLPVLALATAASLSACVQVPTAGPVVEVQANGQDASVEGPFTHPPPPQNGDSPQEIVKGFLNAMTATPIQINVARKFLTPQAQSNWRPQERTIVYSRAPLSGGPEVTVRLGRAHTLGLRGDWEGALPRDESKLVLPMRPETPERWRIATAPNALIVPELWYQQHFQSATLYLFDPTGRRLVPEPVHVPEGDQLATTLVRALLLGPPSSLSQVERSFIPPGLSVGPVTVSSKGVAQVALRGSNPQSLAPKTTQLMLAQLAWTLRQVPTVKAFEVSIGGSQISDATGNSTFSVNGYSHYDPSVSGASAQLYALRDGRLVSGQATRPTPVDGPFGTEAIGIGAFAVSLDDTRIAGVTPFQLLTGAVRGGGTVVHEAYRGTGPLLRPSWDFAGRLWDVEQSPRGARVVVVDGREAHRVRVPGVTGHNVERFLVSRDGSRLVAVIHEARADRLVVSRIQYDAQGRATGGTDTRDLPWEAGGSPRITDIGWASPTTVYVLHPLTHQFAEVRRITVDGSTAQGEASTATIDLARQGLNAPGPGNLPGRVRGLVSSPVDGQTSFAILPHTLVDLDQSLGATTPVPYRRLRHITYAG